MKVSIIAAIGRNLEIGKNNDLLWHLPLDMRFFKETTMHHHVLMGRKNYESIPPKYRPFSNRTNIVISSNPLFPAPECYIVTSLEEGLEIATQNGEDEAFIIGGGQIYQLALTKNLVDIMYLTEVNAVFPDADAHFPKFNREEWNIDVTGEHNADLQHPFDFRFTKLIRK